MRINNKPVLTNIESKNTMIYHSEDDKQVTFTCYLRINRQSKLSIQFASPLVKGKRQFSNEEIPTFSPRSAISSARSSSPTHVTNFESKFWTGESLKGFVSVRKM